MIPRNTRLVRYSRVSSSTASSGGHTINNMEIIPYSEIRDTENLKVFYSENLLRKSKITTAKVIIVVLTRRLAR
jgi:hypothetical protein